MRISDWSSDVCSSDLSPAFPRNVDADMSRAPLRQRRRGRGTELRGQLEMIAGDRGRREAVHVIDELVRLDEFRRPIIRAGGKDRSEERRGGKERVSEWGLRRLLYQ